jgi:hypothetical protein
MDGHALATLYFNVVEQEGYLGIGARCAGLRSDDVPHELRSFGDLGSIGGFDGGCGLDYYIVSSLGRL